MDDELLVNEIVEEVEPTPTPMPVYEEVLAEIKKDVGSMEYEMQSISADVHLIMVLTLLSFCWSCMRAWRKNVTKEMK